MSMFIKRKWYYAPKFKMLIEFERIEKVVTFSEKGYYNRIHCYTYINSGNSIIKNYYIANDRIEQDFRLATEEEIDFKVNFHKHERLENIRNLKLC